MSFSEPPIIGPNHPDLQELHRVLGKALTQWQNIETALYIIAHCLMDTSHKISSLLFFQIRSAENKKALVDRLILERLTQHARTTNWTPISKEIDVLIRFRNMLAHFEIFWLDKLKPEPKPNTQYNLAISSHHLDTYARRSGFARCLTIEQITHNDEEMRKATFYLIDFLVTHVPVLEPHVISLPLNSQRWLALFRKTETAQSPTPPLQSSHE